MRPNITSVECLSNDTTVLQWSDSAYGYAIESVTNLLEDTWTTNRAPLHATTSWTNTPGTHTPLEAFRLRATQ